MKIKKDYLASNDCLIEIGYTLLAEGANLIGRNPQRADTFI